MTEIKLNSRSQKAKDDLLELATLRGVVILEEYVDSKTELFMKCSQGHRFSSTPSRFKAGTGCPKCYSKRLREVRKSFSRPTPM